MQRISHVTHVQQTVLNHEMICFSCVRVFPNWLTNKRKSIDLFSIDVSFVYHPMQTSTNVKAFLARTEEIVLTVTTPTRVAVSQDTTERTVRLVGIVNTQKFSYHVLATI